MTTNEQQVQALMALVKEYAQACCHEYGSDLAKPSAPLQAAVESAIRRALAAPKEQAMPGYVMVPVGWQVVPTTVTVDMRRNAWSSAARLSPNIKSTLDIVWADLLAAAPSPLTAATSAPEPVGGREAFDAWHGGLYAGLQLEIAWAAWKARATKDTQ